MDVEPDSVLVQLYGPSPVNPPTVATQNGVLEPVDGEEIHYYATFAQTAIADLETIYVRLGLSQVTIRDVQYRLQTPLYSNVLTLTWPEAT